MFLHLLKQLAGKTAAATSFYQELLLSCFHTHLAVTSHALHLALRQEEVTNDLLVDAGYINHVDITGKSHRDTHFGLITKVIPDRETVCRGRLRHSPVSVFVFMGEDNGEQGGVRTGYEVCVWSGFDLTMHTLFIRRKSPTTASPKKDPETLWLKGQCVGVKASSRPSLPCRQVHNKNRV